MHSDRLRKIDKVIDRHTDINTYTQIDSMYAEILREHIDSYNQGHGATDGVETR